VNAEERRVDREAAITVPREILKDPKWFIINEHAREIAEMSKTLECDARGIPTREGHRKLFSSTRAQVTAQWLLVWACSRPRLLSALGELIYKARYNDNVYLGTRRPIAFELVAAYEQCTAFHPTLPEVREVFKAREKFRWPGDFYARRLLRSLCLPLRPAKRGPPKKTKRLAQ
jgi:hypothetical protein